MIKKKSKLAVLELKIVDDLIEYYINGRSFLDMVREVELPFAENESHPDIAGDYAGLSPNGIWRLLNEKGFWNGKETLFVCRECLSEMCWGFYAKITITNETVTWSEFENIARDEWKYDKLGVIIFDKSQYLQAIRLKKDEIKPIKWE
jgi:hypothetical protein